MKPYGLQNKSKSNHWDANKCSCGVCNAFARIASNKTKRTQLKSDIRKLTTKIVRPNPKDVNPYDSKAYKRTKKLPIWEQ